MHNRPNNDHDYDSPSLKVAHAGNMRKNMPHICSTYVPHISPNSAYFPTYFASKSSAYFKKILRYKPASLIEAPQSKQCPAAVCDTTDISAAWYSMAMWKGSVSYIGKSKY